jgi:hypothetical protein
VKTKTNKNTIMLIVSGKVATKKGRNRCKEERSKIKLICNRVIHESEIVCRYLNSTLQQSQRETQIKEGVETFDACPQISGMHGSIFGCIFGIYLQSGYENWSYFSSYYQEM